MAALRERSRQRASEEEAEVPAAEPALRLKADPGLDWDWSFQGFTPGAIGGGAEREDVARDGLAGGATEVPHRAEMEERFGQSFEDVRAHTGPEAEEATTSLRANAFTMGRDVAFADASPSRELVAHELTHVVQQRSGGAGGVDADEQQADAVERGASLDAGGRDGGGEALRLDEEDSSEILTKAQIKSAIAFNDNKWKDPHRAELLKVLRGAEGDDSFTESDVVKVAEIQKAEGGKGAEIDGKIGGGTMAVLMRRGLVLSAVKVRPKDVKLLFYPGEYEDVAAWKKAKKDAEGSAEPEYRSFKHPPGHGTIYVQVGGNIVDSMEARGGPPIRLKDFDGHTADPSKEGTYKLGPGKPHVTSAWRDSQIAWGAELREQDGEVQYKDLEGKWQWATGAKSKFKHKMEKAEFHEDGDESKALMSTWRKNDFGAISWRIEGSPGLFIHTTPPDEEAHEVGSENELTCSHGCLHVQPSDRDRLIKRGYIDKGVTIQIKGYDDWLDLGAKNRK